jgi:superfamily II DNA or RNA helicase
LIKLHYDAKTNKGQIICDQATFYCVKNKFSVKNDAAKFAKKYGRKIPDRKYAIDKSGKFDFGLYKEIINILIQEQYTNIEYTEEFKQFLSCGIKTTTVFDGFAFPHRDFQMEIVKLCLKYGRGTIKSATGSGKSFCIASLIENFWANRPKQTYKVLVVVPGISLVSQLQKDFESYKVNFSYSGWTGTNKLENTDVIIVNSENLVSKFDDNSWIKDVDLLIVDECHRCTGTSKISKLITKIKTPNRFGFTGTFPKDQYDVWKILGTFGPLLFEKNSKELRDENILTDVVVKMILLNHSSSDIPKKNKNKDKTPTEDYNIELSYIYNSEKRNNIIYKIVSKIPNNTLILVNHLEHGEALLKSLNVLKDKSVVFIKGEVELNERVEVIANMEVCDNIVCIAMSSIFSTGINIKNLHNIVFASGGKSFVRIVQGIGRGLRLHENKSKLVIFDIYDNLKYSTNHAEERKQIYDDEQIPYKEIEIDL